ncbi:hypothetical protein ACFSUK_16410 [Sphingobium scionense]
MTTDRDDVPSPVERLAEDRNWIASTGLSRRHILAGGAFAAGFAAACQPVAASTIQTPTGWWRKPCRSRPATVSPCPASLPYRRARRRRR